MERIGKYADEIRALAERCAARAETPEFKANAARLARESAAQEAAHRETDRKLRLHVSGVPMTLWDAVKAPHETPALEAAREFLNVPAALVFLALAGPAGRGKTFAAAWTVAERGGVYALAHDLVTAGSFDPIWRDLAAANVLALDELGAEYRNDAFAASLYTLLNTRHAHGRKTVLCTNLDGGAFMARYCPDPNDPLRDRMRTSSRWLNLPGESMRRPWNETDKEDESDGE